MIKKGNKAMHLLRMFLPKNVYLRQTKINAYTSGKRP